MDYLNSGLLYIRPFGEKTQMSVTSYQIYQNTTMFIQEIHLKCSLQNAIHFVSVSRYCRKTIDEISAIWNAATWPFNVSLGYMNPPPLHHIDRLVQERCNSSPLAMELRLNCINPSICPKTYLLFDLECALARGSGFESKGDQLSTSGMAKYESVCRSLFSDKVTHTGRLCCDMWCLYKQFLGIRITRYPCVYIESDREREEKETKRDRHAKAGK